MARWWLAVGLAGCTPEIDLFEPDLAPTASVRRPSPGASLPAGPATFEGIVADPQSRPERLFTLWDVGGPDADDAGGWRPACAGFADEAGVTLCVASLEVGETRVRLLVKDPAGYQGIDEVAVAVDASVGPTVSLAPLAPGRRWANVPVALAGTVRDPDDPPSSLRLVWRSDRLGAVDGPVTLSPTGELAGTLTLPEGLHTLTLTATDPGGAVGVGSLRALIGPPDAPPTCALHLPDAVVAPDTAVSVGWTVLDAEDPPSALVVALGSDLDGPLGGGVGGAGGVEVTLRTVGEQVLTLEAVDPNGGACVVSGVLTVGSPPVVGVDAPADGARLPLGSPITFAVRVVDPDGDAAAGTFALSARGAAGLSAPPVGPFALQPDPADAARAVGQAAWALPLGEHTVTVTVTDEDGLTATRSVGLTVIP